ncbi:MAG: DUF4115 domain-containing protein [bacterium]|nr:MAG: DUF4115 domain-containing protein [bacterium]
MREEELLELGEKLKKTRDEKKIDLKKISDQTKININFLKSIEEGKFDFLPELYVRSFLKLYLEQLGEDASHFLNEYDSIKTDKELKVTVVTDEDLKNINKPKQLRNQISTMIEKLKPYIRQINLIWLGIGAVIVILVIYSLIKDRNNHQVVSAGSTGKLLIVEPQRNSLDTIPSLPVEKIFNDNKDLNLELNALKKTWMQISVDDSVAKEHIFDNGMTYSWHAKKKFRLLIGNAGGIRLFLNGKNLGPLGKAGEVIKIDLTEDGIQNSSL